MKGFKKPLSVRKIVGFNMTDLEPGRCRRTDGRKWRCSKDVVQNHKYCERHVNRGRRGSRKHVENSVTKCGSFEPIMEPLSCDNHQILGLTSGSTHGNSSSDVLIKPTDVFQSTNLTRRCNRKRPVYQSNEFGFIPLEFSSAYGKVAGNVNSESGGKNGTKTEPRRCRRTDGRRWQCGRDALPFQKYCEAHIHRGAKRIGMNSKSAKVSPSSPATLEMGVGILHSFQLNLDSCINLNITPECPEMGGNNPRDSTSDATTITD